MKIKNIRIALTVFCLLNIFSYSFSQGTAPANGNNSPGTSDRKAVEIAKKVMKAMGGQKAWDNTHYISWIFFGSRTLLWDKWTGYVRIEWQKKSQKIIVNLRDGTGKVQLNGVEQSHPDSLAKYLQIGREVWINDSYWLVMPFKLLDPGVTLQYLGRNKTEDGRKAYLLQLTFDKVGVTPENKYKVWVDKKTHLVTQWAYFQKYSDSTPRFTNPWVDYKRYGNILLSGDRGREGRSLYPIEVLDRVAEGVFEGF